MYIYIYVKWLVYCHVLGYIIIIPIIKERPRYVRVVQCVNTEPKYYQNLVRYEKM